MKNQQENPLDSDENNLDKNPTQSLDNFIISPGLDDSLSKGLDNSNIINLQSQILNIINNNLDNGSTGEN